MSPWRTVGEGPEALDPAAFRSATVHGTAVSGRAATRTPRPASCVPTRKGEPVRFGYMVSVPSG
jgi:hypothetical protein